MKKICPNCGSSKGIREYIYGMPAGPVDERKFEIGGCTEGFAEDSPTHKCINCEWEGVLDPEGFSTTYNPPTFIDAITHVITTRTIQNREEPNY